MAWIASPEYFRTRATPRPCARNDPAILVDLDLSPVPRVPALAGCPSPPAADIPDRAASQDHGILTFGPTYPAQYRLRSVAKRPLRGYFTPRNERGSSSRHRGTPNSCHLPVGLGAFGHSRGARSCEEFASVGRRRPRGPRCVSRP